MLATRPRLQPVEAPESAPVPASFSVTGVRVHAVQISDTIEIMERWIAARDACRLVAVTGMHGVSVALEDPSFRRVLAQCDLVVPDGMSLVLLGRLHGWPLKRRVYGPELMLEFCRRTAGRGYRHFFYGGAPGVADDLVARLRAECPGFLVAGTVTPPFRELSSPERDDVRARINAAGADVLWVGLGTPKQERFMWENREALRVPVMVGVGAAFDLHAGRVRQAPVWMREHGLEWSWRLAQEPRRLWRRYLVNGSQFAWNVMLELSGLKRFD